MEILFLNFKCIASCLLASSIATEKSKTTLMSDLLYETFFYLMEACGIFSVSDDKICLCVCMYVFSFIHCRHLRGPFNSFGNSWASFPGNFRKLSLGCFPLLFLFYFSGMSIIEALYVLYFILPLTHFSIFLFLFLEDFLSFIIYHFSSKFLKWNLTCKQQSAQLTSMHLAQWLIRNWKHLHDSNPGQKIDDYFYLLLPLMPHSSPLPSSPQIIRILTSDTINQFCCFQALACIRITWKIC